LILAIIAGRLFFDNPSHASVAEVKAIIAGDRRSIEHVIYNGLHLGALIALSILTFWLLIAPSWASRRLIANTFPSQFLTPGPDLAWFRRQSSDGLSRRWFLILVLLAVATGGLLRAPLLDHSFWNDEEVAYRKFIHGSHSIGENGEAEWKPLPWKRTWFYNVTGNNHVLQSVGSRFTIEHFGNDPAKNNEALARALPFAAGLLTIFALAFLIWQAGAGLPAILAAWILALHPWHLRYSVEARGYSGMLFFAILTMVFLLAALQRKTWPTWLGFGLSQLACLLCFPAAVYFIFVLNFGVLFLLVSRGDFENLQRWSTVSVVGAAVFIQIMTPSFLRMLEWLRTPYEAPHPLDAAWFLNLWSHVAAGLPIYDGHQARAFQLDLSAWQRTGGVRYWLLIAVLPVLALTGGVHAVIRHPLLRWPVLGALAAFFLVLGHLLVKPMVFHVWYLLSLLLPFCIGLASVPDLALRWKKSAGWISAIVILLAFGLVAASPLIRLREYPRHPIRDAVEAVRKEAPALSPEQVDTFTVAVGHGSGQFSSYDPRVEVAKDESQFQALLEKPRRDGQRLFVYCVDQRTVTEQFPAIAKTLLDADQFREIAYLHGVEAFWSITIYESTSNIGSSAE
jgi:hypothetical protein